MSRTINRELPIGRLLVGAALIALALFSPVRDHNRLLMSVAVCWGALFLLSAALHRTEFGQLLAGTHRDERQVLLETRASEVALVVLLIGAVVIVALSPAWTAAMVAIVLMGLGLVAYLGGLLYGTLRA